MEITGRIADDSSIGIDNSSGNLGEQVIVPGESSLISKKFTLQNLSLY